MIMIGNIKTGTVGAANMLNIGSREGRYGISLWQKTYGEPRVRGVRLMEVFNRADVNNPDVECVYCGSANTSDDGPVTHCGDCKQSYVIWSDLPEGE